MRLSRFMALCLTLVAGINLLSCAACTGGPAKSETGPASVPELTNYNYTGTVSVVEAFNLLNIHSNDSDFVILDLRTPAERALVAIRGSILLDWYSGYSQQILSLLDKTRTYLIY